MQLFCSIQKIYWFLLSTWHYLWAFFGMSSNVSIFWFCSIYSLRWFLISIRILAWTQMNHLGKNGDKNLIRNPWWKTRVFSDDERGGGGTNERGAWDASKNLHCTAAAVRSSLPSRFCLTALLPHVLRFFLGFSTSGHFGFSDQAIKLVADTRFSPWYP